MFFGKFLLFFVNFILTGFFIFFHKGSLSALRKFLSGGRYRKLAVFYPAQGFKLVGDGPDLFSFSFQDQDLQAVIVIQVNMNRRDNRGIVMVLDFGERLGQLPLRVGEDQADHPDHFPVPQLPFLFRQAFPQIPISGLSRRRYRRK